MPGKFGSHYREPRCGVYVAVNSDGNIYVGKSWDMYRRGKQHARNGKTVIHENELDCMSILMHEERFVHFYQLQAQEESFDVLNKNKLIDPEEIERRYGHE